MTEKELKLFSPATPDTLTPTILKWFNEYAGKYKVNTPLRIAAFLSQVIHESGSFKYVHEIATGAAYEGRKDLGNVYTGDGKRFKGRGYIQITGRNNYAAVSKFIFGDVNTLLCNPDLLATPQYAMLSAFWFWDAENLNALADKQFLLTISIRINGRNKETGLPNGWVDRVRIYNRICKKYGLLQYDINTQDVTKKDLTA